MNTGRKVIIAVSATLGICSFLAYLFSTISDGSFMGLDLLIALILAILAATFSAVIMDFLAYHAAGKAFFLNFSKKTFQKLIEEDEESTFCAHVPGVEENPLYNPWWNDLTNPASTVYQAISTYRMKDIDKP